MSSWPNWLIFTSYIRGFVGMIDAVEKHREALEDLAETDLPAADIAEQLLEAADETGS